jgi:hypothetical protein
VRVFRSVAALAGITNYNYYLLRTLKRPEWLYRGYFKIPKQRLTFLAPAKSTPADVALCERLIFAHQRATSRSAEDTSLSPLWSEITQRHQGGLQRALEKKDPNLLAGELSSMFRKEFLYGIASGHLYTHARSAVGARIWSMRYLDDIVSLAEYLGVVRTECPEQGVVAYALKDGLDALVERIEQTLGFGIGFPPVGAPYGIQARGSLITMEAPEHIYVACRIARALGDHLPKTFSASPNIVEIGAGFGGTAYWLLRLRNLAVQRYTLVDVPNANVLQGYFLSQVFGTSHVRLFGESTGEHPQQPIITILPPQGIGELRERDVDMLINQNSMPEMPEETVASYLAWARETLRGLFYSYNQEAFSPVRGVPQVLVPEVIRRVRGFSLVSRNASWMRRGYVEELYSCAHDCL